MIFSHFWFIKVHYGTGVEVEAGNELNATLVQMEPVELQWPFQEGRRYTLIMSGKAK